MKRLVLSVLGCTLHIECGCTFTHRLVASNFGLLIDDAADDPVRTYRVVRQDSRYFLNDGDGHTREWNDDGALLYDLEKTLTIDLQRLRQDLLFIHSGVVARDGRGLLLVAASGTGKSTTTLALRALGFDYLSDELAPIDLNTGQVLPYPHALCLKRIPPGQSGYPPGGLQTSRTFHLPAELLTGGRRPTAVPIAALVFLERGAEGAACRPITAAEAGARLYSEVLNALAHPAHGLDAVLSVTARIPAFRVTMAGVSETAVAVAGTLPTAGARAGVTR